jgi:tRNA A-37 threonylcarbamoyl transferase component Bud32
MSNSSQCQCLTKAGTRCKNSGSQKKGNDHHYCHLHQKCINPINIGTPNHNPSTVPIHIASTVTKKPTAFSCFKKAKIEELKKLGVDDAEHEMEVYNAWSALPTDEIANWTTIAIKSTEISPSTKVTKVTSPLNFPKKIKILPKIKPLNSISEVPKIPVQLDLNSFDIIQKIGSGAFSEVFTAKNKIDGSIVVLKKISKSKTDKKSVTAEIDILRLFKEFCQEYILCYDGYFEDADNYYLLTEYLKDYISLKEMIVQLHSSPMTDKTTKTIKNIASKLIDGLKLIHTLSAAHRDIKPANIMVSNDGKNIKYIDFGLSCFESSCHTSSINGTYIYMAPEIVSSPHGHTFDLIDLQKSDLWSLGATLFELQVGHGHFFDLVIKNMSSLDKSYVDYQHIKLKTEAFMKIVHKYLPNVLKTYIPDSFLADTGVKIGDLLQINPKIRHF